MDVTLIRFNGHGHTDRSLRLTPEDPEFAPLLRRLEALRFRRSPTNLLLQAMPFLQDLLPAAVKTTRHGENPAPAHRAGRGHRNGRVAAGGPAIPDRPVELSGL